MEQEWLLLLLQALRRCSAFGIETARLILVDRCFIIEGERIWDRTIAQN